MSETSKNCFVCGPDNKYGLQAEFSAANGVASARFLPLRKHEGLGQVVHGAILSALADEAMSKAASSLGAEVVTAELTVRFTNPATIGNELSISAKVDCPGRIIECSAEIRETSTEVLIAKSKARMFPKKS